MAKKKKKKGQRKSSSSKKASSARKTGPKPVSGQTSLRGAPDGPKLKRTMPGASPLPGARSIEAEMAKMGRYLEGKDFESIDKVQKYINSLIEDGSIAEIAPTTPAEQAQELIYNAWESIDEERVELAMNALEVYPDCADAYVILAQESESPMESYSFFREGVEAGERALGPGYFEEDVGHFWGILETRPYMRARFGLARFLWELGKQGKAVEHLEYMLRLNPGDNQGVRYILASWYVMMDRDEDLWKLLDSYGDEPTACWAYTKALASFRKEGDTKASTELLMEAIETNPHVPAYFLGESELPDEPPYSIGFGDETEAIDYAMEFLLCWYLTDGALEWLERYSR